MHISSNRAIRTKSFLRLDLHGMNRWKARKQLFLFLIRLFAQRKSYLFVIHGYRHGTVLRDYIRDGTLSKDLRKEFPHFPQIKIAVVDEGTTRVVLSKEGAS